MTPKKWADPLVEEKIRVYLRRMISGFADEEGKRPILSELAKDLDEDKVFAEQFFQTLPSVGAELPKGCLAELYSLLSTKQAQKALKKAHYRLTQKGLRPDPLPGGEVGGQPGVLKLQEDFQPLGYLSDWDSQRYQMVALLIPQGASGRLLLLALIGEEGLSSLTVFESGKKRAKEFLADVVKETEQSFYEADFPHATFVLKEAHDRYSALPREDERLYAQVMAFLEEKGMVGRTPIIRSLLGGETMKQPPLPVEEDLERIREVIFLLPSIEDMKGYLAQVQEVDDSPLVLNAFQKRERKKDLIRKAVEESFPKERWGYLLRFLEEAAYLRYLKGEQEEAQFLYAWARTFGETDTYSSPADHLLLSWLMDMILLSEEYAESGSRIKAEPRTPGGIIIPAWAEKQEVEK